MKSIFGFIAILLFIVPSVSAGTGLVNAIPGSERDSGCWDHQHATSETDPTGSYRTDETHIRKGCQSADEYVIEGPMRVRLYEEKETSSDTYQRTRQGHSEGETAVERQTRYQGVDEERTGAEVTGPTGDSMTVQHVCGWRGQSDSESYGWSDGTNEEGNEHTSWRTVEGCRIEWKAAGPIDQDGRLILMGCSEAAASQSTISASGETRSVQHYRRCGVVAEGDVAGQEWTAGHGTHVAYRLEESTSRRESLDLVNGAWVYAPGDIRIHAGRGTHIFYECTPSCKGDIQEGMFYASQGDPATGPAIGLGGQHYLVYLRVGSQVVAIPGPVSLP